MHEFRQHISLYTRNYITISCFSMFDYYSYLVCVFSSCVLEVNQVIVSSNLVY